MIITNAMIPHISAEIFVKMSPLEKVHHYNLAQMKNAFRMVKNEKLALKHRA